MQTSLYNIGYRRAPASSFIVCSFCDVILPPLFLVCFVELLTESRWTHHKVNTCQMMGGKAQQRMVFMNEAFVFIFVSLFPKFVKYKILTINLKFVWKHLWFNNGGMISVCHGFFFLLSWIIMIVKEISTVCCLVFHTSHWQKYYFHKRHTFE